jgi:S1-C subfamily serine protease
MAELLSRLSEDLADTVDQAGPSVVRVEARRRLPASGIVWSPDGVIVTAHHVIERDDNIKVGLPNGRSVAASLVGRDPTIDVAVLRVRDDALEGPASNGDMGEPRVGHMVLALGRPGQSVLATLGIVSALGDAWRTPAGGSIDRYLQTDLVMYPGFSGGPLVDAAGHILGLNTSALLRGTAITVPAATLERVVETLLAHGRIRRGYLGVGVQPVRLPDGLVTEVSQETGLLVASVESGGPADKGGLLVGDIIVSIDGAPSVHMDSLLAQLGGDRVGHEASLHLVRGGKPHEITVVIGERK